MTRRAYWILAGVLGLMVNAGVMLLLYMWEVARQGRPILSLPVALSGGPLVLAGWGAWLAYAILLGLALAEIPLMTAGLRALAGSQTRSDWFLYGGNLIFVLFPAVYAFIFVLLTNRLPLGLTIAGTGALRLLAGAIWVRPE